MKSTLVELRIKVMQCLIIILGTKILQEFTVVGEPYKFAYSNAQSNIFQSKKLELEQLVSKDITTTKYIYVFIF